MFVHVWFRNFLLLPVLLVLSACQMQPLPAERARAIERKPAPATSVSRPALLNHLHIDVPVAWGGQVRCAKTGCKLIAVEHERGRVVLHQINGRSSKFLDAQKVAYHPDSAIWLSDDLVAVAVEIGASIDIFRVVQDRLIKVTQIVVNFAPRDVMLVKEEAGRYTMLATPYSGKEVAWIDGWSPSDSVPARVRHVTWCEAAWHPVRVPRLPGLNGGGVAVACLDDRKIVAVSDADLFSVPRTVATLPAIPRNVQVSPSGGWLYASLETGGKNARVNMVTGELQWVQSPLTGSVSNAALDDDLVIWGDGLHLYLQRLGAQGEVLETRWHKIIGSGTRSQLLDVDGDGERDLIVYHTGEQGVEVVFGPLWEAAASAQP